MKKLLLVFLIVTSISMSGWAAHKAPPKEKVNKISFKSTQNTLFWQCWDYTVSCGSGFVCANTYNQALLMVAIIELTYCGDVPPCDP